MASHTQKGRSGGFNSGGGFNSRIEGRSGGARPRAMRVALTPAVLFHERCRQLQLR